VVRISTGFMFLLVRNVTIKHCTAAKGTICSLTVITSDKKHIATQQYVIIVICIPFLTTNKVILFYMGSSALEKKVLVYISTLSVA
jgi:hypothetical protein